MASTKCCWNIGSTAVSIFSIRRTTASISSRAFGVEQRDARAGAGGIAGRLHLLQRAIGDQAEDHRVLDVDMAAEGAGEPDAVDLLDAELVHQQARAGIERGLGQLDGAHVVLRDR